jgi:drug/metabolite transporter (DMT)-like permease
MVLAAVLSAAFLDALQHCLIKSGHDPFARALGVAVVGGVLALPLLFLTGLPAPASWPLLGLSIALGSLYWVTLGWAYHSGTLAMVFPLSRGSSVVLTALGGRFILQDRLTSTQGLMLVVMLLGLCLVAFSLRQKGRVSAGSLVPTACVALLTASFTLVDAAGVRLAGSATAYCLALYLGNALVVGGFAVVVHGNRLAGLPRAALPGLALSAVLSLLAYTLILFGLRHGPVAIVAALAETSIVFAALLGIFWLRERTSPSHSLGLTAIAAAVILLRLEAWPVT